MALVRFRVFQAFSVGVLLLTGLGFGAGYQQSKDGHHPIGWLILGCTLLALAFLAARQKPPLS